MEGILDCSNGVVFTILGVVVGVVRLVVIRSPVSRKKTVTRI